jgi:7-carboxy-7-deazaguanine synthase
MKVCEIFYSIEGEGLEVGKPYVFVRLAGCNLRCKWCDTKYAWNESVSVGMTVDRVIREIERYGCSNVSITGGEPLLQAVEVYNLINEGYNWFFQINTNGTLYSEDVFDIVDLITMDCKCPSSCEKSDLNVIKKTYENYAGKAQFKFVISNAADYEYATSIILTLELQHVPIIFQPEWGSGMKWRRQLIELVKNDAQVWSNDYDVRVIPQVQKVIWGGR